MSFPFVYGLVMNYAQLKDFDSNLELIAKAPADNENVETICDLEFLTENGLVILGDTKFLDKFMKLENAPKVHVVLGPKVKDADLQDRALSVWCSAKPLISMSKLSAPFYERKVRGLNSWHDGRQSGEAQVDPTSLIAQGVFLGENVKIGANVRIHAGVVISSHCEIGEGSEIYPNVTIYPFTKIGKHVRLHGGSTIGADGFGYNFDAGVHHKVWHFGGVVLGDHVEIGANSCVDSGTFSPTLIGAGSKLDNHVQIGHNCQLGHGVIVCGHVALGGSTKLGDFTVVGGKAGFGNGLTLGKACQVAGGALVNCDWPDGSVVAGHPARPLKEWLKGVAWLRKESLKGTR